MNLKPTAQLPLDLSTEPSMDRDDLVESSANALAIGAIDAWPDWPHPVMVVVGPAGSGKTHLAAAWARRAGARSLSPGDELPATPFVVTLEDIDRTPFSDAELFAVLNAARLGGGQVLATSRQLPAGLPIALPDLRSRLNAATLVEIAPPDDALLAGVLVKLAADRQIALDAPLIDYALKRMDRTLAGAAALVRRLDMETLAAKERISLTALRRILTEMASETGSPS